ncbi:GGDEF domain-containing protein [Methylobacterium sp. J-090]|uniref:GGDEF domain-containing protein n=1 Tax=Methylobacterium sp. J-090 TaxID=2836666 RepID=UPI001FBB69E2|nr:GGDEF domain-containing protein [Methylobacterium sp. J-090]MCJ2083854.1 GGDEF domain-containing protein [Methylobacterium sp. J-090]
MLLDLATLHFASAASRCAYVIVFLVMALSQRGQTFLWHWMGAMGASMAGSFMMMGVPPETLPSVPVTMVVYWLYSASLVLSWTGFRSFFGQPVNVGLGVFLAALPGILYPVVLATGLSSRFALAAVFACCSVVAALTSYETLRRMPGVARLWSQYIEAVAFGAYALILLLSIGMLLGTDRPIASAESARASLILDQVAGVFVYFGYIAMTAERASRRLVRIAETDPLTELYNRRGLAEALRQRFAGRDGHPSAGLLIADLDHFKSINDAHGHEGGDRVLTAFAKRMRNVLRGTDLVARWGGEEFLVVLPGATQRELAAVAERLRASVADEPFSLRTGALAVTVSIGTTTMDPNDDDFERAVHRADAALYAAKSGGRDRVCSAPTGALPDGVQKNEVQVDGVPARCDDAVFA